MTGLAASEAGVTCSVCIAHYNGLGLIDACIESVRMQTCGFSVEIIVHDDASTDGSAEHIAARHPGVRLLASRENAGYCVANNRMAAAARGEFLLLLNNDATLLPDALSALRAESIRIGRPAILSLPQYAAESGDLLDFGSLLDPFLNPVPNLDPAHNDVAMVAGACLWIPKALWQELGGFPEWFGSVAEDLFLCSRARLAGHPVRALATSGYRHHVGQSFGGGKAVGGRLASTYRRRALSERNKTFVMIACYPLPLLAFALPLHAAMLLLEGAALSLQRREWRPLAEIYLPALSACWRERARLRELRRAVQAGRCSGLSAFFSAFRFLPHKLTMLLRHGLPQLS